MIRETVQLDTYPPMFVDDDCQTENEDYDNQLRLFVVPLAWAVSWVWLQHRIDFETFKKEYTWDDTYRLYDQAVKDGVVISTEIVDR